MGSVTVHPDDVMALVEGTKHFKNEKVSRLAKCAAILVSENNSLKSLERHQRDRLAEATGRIMAAREALNPSG